MKANIIQSKPKLDSLTSLRFIAAMLIVLGHGHPYFGSFGLATTLSLAQGVSFFFVLSGYILAYNYPQLPDFTSLRKFYRARLARIWPLHVAGILILLLLTKSLNTGTLQGFDQLVFAGVSNLLLVQSLIPLRDVYLVFNGVAWSLSTEIVFYFVFPLLINGRKLGWNLAQLILPAFVLLAFLIFSSGWNISADESYSGVSLMGLLYVNPMARLFEFSLGVSACRVFCAQTEYAPRFKSLCPFSCAELVATLLCLTSMYLSPRLIELSGFRGHFAAVISYYLAKSGSAIVFALLIIIFSFGRGFLSRLLSMRPFVLLGEISFALYIVHMSILTWYVQHQSLFNAFHPSFRVSIYWLLCLLFAYLMHKGIEEPMRRLLLGKTMKIIKLETLFGGQALRSCLLLICLLALLRIG
jgi:peptidoglycan/LPS O-acetylase OafA/YrhL